MRFRLLLMLWGLTGCGGLAWNTTVADHPQVRQAMLASVQTGMTEKSFTSRWGNPAQKIREGAQVSYVYRNTKNPTGYYVPQFGNSGQFVVVSFQYGLAVGAYSSDTQGCRATFAPRPPGHGFDNPTTVHTVNCGVAYDGSSEHRPIADAISWLNHRAQNAASAATNALPPTWQVPPPTPLDGPPPSQIQNVPSDSYDGTLK